MQEIPCEHRFMLNWQRETVKIKHFIYDGYTMSILIGLYNSYWQLLTCNTHLPSIYPRQLSVNGCVNNFQIVPLLIYFDLSEMKSEDWHCQWQQKTEVWSDFFKGSTEVFDCKWLVKNYKLTNKYLQSFVTSFRSEKPRTVQCSGVVLKLKFNDISIRQNGS